MYFAVTSFFVTSRSREIGVRIALGANTGQIARAVMVPALRFAVPGAAAGIGGAFLLGRTMRSVLYETSPLDPVVLFGAVAVLLIPEFTCVVTPKARIRAGFRHGKAHDQCQSV